MEVQEAVVDGRSSVEASTTTKAAAETSLPEVQETHGKRKYAKTLRLTSDQLVRGLTSDVL